MEEEEKQTNSLHSTRRTNNKERERESERERERERDRQTDSRSHGIHDEVLANDSIQHRIVIYCFITRSDTWKVKKNAIY